MSVLDRAYEQVCMEEERAQIREERRALEAEGLAQETGIPGGPVAGAEEDPRKRTLTKQTLDPRQLELCLDFSPDWYFN